MTSWDDLTKPGLASNFFKPPPLESFRAGLAEYDDINAWWLMELSRLIYCRRNRKPHLPKGIEEIKFFGSERKKAFGAADTQGVIVADTQRTWAAVVFRGTETPADWLTNVLCRLVECPSAGRAHHGFVGALDCVWEKEIAPVLETLPPSCAIYYTGHSLGGALATLAATRRKPTATYTYGGPLVGDAALASGIDVEHLYRVVNQEDVVACVPIPIPFFLPYQHLGQLHSIGSRSAGPTLKESLALLLTNPGLPEPPDPLADHAPINYVNLLGMRARLPARA